MTRLERRAIATAAAATVAVASLTFVPAASALPAITCHSAQALARAYIATGDAFLSLGSSSVASYW